MPLLRVPLNDTRDTHAMVPVQNQLLQRLRVQGWWVYLPIALVVWGLMHASGIHATVAGVGASKFENWRLPTYQAPPPSAQFSSRKPSTGATTSSRPRPARLVSSVGGAPTGRRA